MPESTMHGIEFGSKFATGRIEHLKRHAARRKNASRVTERSTATLLEIIGDLIGLLFYFFMTVLVIICHRAQETRKSRHDLLSIATIIGREIGAPVEWAAVGRKEDGHWPATLLCKCLYGLHVNVIYIRPFFTIYFNRNKMLIHQASNVFVL